MELSEPTRRRIAEHCRKVSVARNLDPEIQRELAAHMEDKVLAYLHGQETLTEADAFVIARERFGDPALIKDLLGGVHAGAAAASLGRRVLAITLLVNLLTFVSLLLRFGLLSILRRLAPDSAAAQTLALYFEPLIMLSVALALFVLQFKTLKRWKTRLEQGFTPWALRWPVALLLPLALASFVFVPASKIVSHLLFVTAPATHTPQPVWYGLLISAVLLLFVLANVILWFWWCDAPPRRPGAMRQVALWFIGYVLLGSLIDSLIRMAPAHAFPHSAPVLFSAKGWTVYFSFNWVSDASSHLLIMIVLLALSFLGFYLYEAARKRFNLTPDDPGRSLSA